MLDQETWTIKTRSLLETFKGPIETWFFVLIAYQMSHTTYQTLFALNFNKDGTQLMLTLSWLALLELRWSRHVIPTLTLFSKGVYTLLLYDSNLSPDFISSLKGHKSWTTLNILQAKIPGWKDSSASVNSWYWIYQATKRHVIRSVSLENLYKECGWATVLQRRQQQHKLSFMYNVNSGMVPSYKQDLITTLVSEISDYPLKNNRNISVPLNRTSISQKSCIPSAIRLWNSLDDNSKDISTLPTFKKHIFSKLSIAHVPPYFTVGNRYMSVLHARLRNKCSGLNGDIFRNHIRNYLFLYFVWRGRGCLPLLLSVQKIYCWKTGF